MRTVSDRTAASEAPALQRTVVTVGCALATGIWAEILLLVAGG
jgi:hypothetical protein